MGLGKDLSVMGVRRLVAAVVVALVALGVAGCGGEPPESSSGSARESGSPAGSASPSPSVSASGSSPSSSSSTSESPDALEEPTPPAAMKGDDAAAAEAFVEYYFEMFDYVSLTGDLRTFRTLGLRTCSACNGVIDTVDDVFARGGKVRGGESELSNIVIESRGELEGGNRPYGALADVRVKRQRVSGTGSSKLDGRFPPAEFQVRADLIRTDGGWRMASWEQL